MTGKKKLDGGRCIQMLWRVSLRLNADEVELAPLSAKGHCCPLTEHRFTVCQERKELHHGITFKSILVEVMWMLFTRNIPRSKTEGDDSTMVYSAQCLYDQKLAMRRDAPFLTTSLLPLAEERNSSLCMMVRYLTQLCVRKQYLERMESGRVIHLPFFADVLSLL